MQVKVVTEQAECGEACNGSGEAPAFQVNDPR